jgi:peptide deformylase
MAVLPIVEVPDPILSERAREVEEVTDELRKLIDDMADTMYAAPGVGLAAPQVGVGLRIIVADLDTEIEEVPGSDEEAEDQRELYALVNPEIVEREGTCDFEEGCLSVPDYTIEIQRTNRIVVQALDADGEEIELEAIGFPAVVLQHELDHLDGKTLVDRMSPLKRRLYLKGQRKKLAALDD